MTQLATMKDVRLSKWASELPRVMRYARRRQSQRQRQWRIALYASDIAAGRQIAYVYHVAAKNKHGQLCPLELRSQAARAITDEAVRAANVPMNEPIAQRAAYVALFAALWRQYQNISDPAARFALAIYESANADIKRPELLGQMGARTKSTIDYE